MPRNLVLMGSGETSPTMVSEHARLLADAPSSRGSLVLLETTYGFQENADDLTRRIQAYFSESLQREVHPLPLRDITASRADVAATVSALREASWLFAGPGSPTYALRVWRETGIADAILDLLHRGTAVFASAAALTVGTHTVPVYEIYKVGEPPAWQPGLDVLGALTGLRAAVVPHFDNADGGTHDTRFCYIGERRMRALEQQLPRDVFILGIDEHTGVRFDLDARVAHVFGRGRMTVRMGGRVWELESGASIPFTELAAHAGTRLDDVPTESPRVFDAEAVHSMLDAGQVLDAVDALLAMDAVDHDPSSRAAVHALILRLGQLAANPRVDLETVVAPYIDALLEARSLARQHGFWAEADAIRDRLTDLRVQVTDGPGGSSWQIAAT